MRLFVAIIGLLFAGLLFAQTPPAAFEVASVKPEPWKGNGTIGVFIRGNTLTGEHISLYDLVEFAHNLKDFQLTGGPTWAQRGLLASSDLYQVIAKAAGDSPPSEAEFRFMLQGLLADRFRLQVHHADKEFPVFNLVIAKNGPKLTESAPDSKFSMQIDGGGKQPLRIRGTKVPLNKLIDYIAHDAGRPVFDATGLSGSYDFEIEWAQDSLAGASPDAPSAPSIFTVLTQRFGLKLEPGTAPFDTVVIDHAEKPTEN